MLRDALEAILEGRPVVQSFGPDLSALGALFTEHLHSNGLTVAVLGRHLSGLDAIGSVLGLEGRLPHLEDVPLVDGLRNTVLKVQSNCPDITAWGMQLLRSMTQRPLAGAMGLWIVERAAGDIRPRQDSRQFRLSLESCVGLSEMRAHAATLFVSQLGPGPTHYFEALARELSGPDYELLEQLSRLRRADFLDIGEVLRHMETGLGGRVIAYGGQPWTSSIALAQRSFEGDDTATSKLEARIRRAQLQELMPALETERSVFLEKHAAAFQAAASEAKRRIREVDLPDRIPADLEWGNAFWLSGFIKEGRALREVLHQFRDARNQLAHGEMLDAPELRQLLATCASTFKGEWAVNGLFS